MLCYYIIDVQLEDWGQKREIRKRRSDTDGYGRHKIRNSMVMEIIWKERSYIINVNKNCPDITIWNSLFGLREREHFMYKIQCFYLWTVRFEFNINICYGNIWLYNESRKQQWEFCRNLQSWFQVTLLTLNINSTSTPYWFCVSVCISVMFLLYFCCISDCSSVVFLLYFCCISFVFLLCICCIIVLSLLYFFWLLI